jgi:arylamine N-acetyltransferase
MYSAEQIDSYLSRISFPVKKYPKPTAAADRVDESFKYLSQLQKCHLSSIPFENLALHYSPAPKISLDKDIVYDKIVRKARGGYCMELNLLFANVLKGLGYEVVQTGARVFGASEELDGW